MIDKRQQILQATAEMITECGLESCPMSKISARAGCGAGTIYRYFETKDDLVRALFKESIKKLTLVCLANYDADQSLRQRYYQIWGNYFEFICCNPRERGLMEQLFASPAISCEDKDEAFAQLREATFPILDEGKQQGVFKDVPNDILNTFVFGSLNQMSKKMELSPETCGCVDSDILMQLCWDAIRR